MNKTRILFIVLLMLSSFVYGQATIATDNAGNPVYGDGWTHGDNGGTGFGAWVINSGSGYGFAGNFIGNPSEAGITGMSSTSFGLYSNPNSSGAWVTADRTFSSPLGVNQIFSVQLGVNWNSGYDGSKGIVIYTGGTSGTEIILIQITDSDIIRINGNTMFANYGTQAMTINFELLSATSLRVYGTGRNGSENYNHTFTISGAPDAIRFLSSQLQAGTQAQLYANNLKIVDPALPVELTSFAAKQNGNNVTLNWKTATEVSSNRFVVERSLKTEVGSQTALWETVGEVKASGNSNSPKEYSFTDKKLNSGNFSYRLKMIDNDGTFEYSKEIEVDILRPSTFDLRQNYPNPFNPSTVISYQLPVKSLVRLDLFSITGEKIATLVNDEQESGYYNYPLSTVNYQLSSGVYIYRMIAGEFVSTKKLMLIK